MTITALFAISLLASAQQSSALQAQLAGCKATRPNPGPPAKCNDEDGKGAALYDSKKPETLRSNLCLAKKLHGSLEVDYSWFGHNDHFASKHDREIKKLKYVVVHNGGYDAKHNAHTWECRPASSHYSIQRDGKIFQHVGEEKIAAHAGGKHSTMKQLNHESIGIELNIGKHKGTSCNSLKVKKDAAGAAIVKDACAPTAAQYASLKKLLRAIAARTSVKLDEEHVIGHCESVGRAGHGDPKAFDWTQIGLSNEKKLAKIDGKGTACGWYHLYSASGPIQQAAQKK